jgi:transcriptional regulator with XRE-family HTH domain
MSEEAWRAIGSRLREIRREAGLTGRELGSLLGWHSSKVSKHEYARRLPSTADIRAWCAACGVPDEAGDLIASLRSVEGAYVEWKRLESLGLKHANEIRRASWENASKFRIYANWNVPSPLQTPAYIGAVLRSMVARRNLLDDVDEAVPVRVSRQAVLNRSDRSFAIVLEEAVLRYVIGDGEVMLGQLGHLLTVSTLPNVSLGIIPLTANRTLSWPVETFYCFDSLQVTVELVANFLTVTKPAEIDLYHRSFKDLSSMAVYGSEARKLIARAIDALDS